MSTKREVNDQVAQAALCYGGKSCKMPTHSSMASTEENPDASATDAEPDSEDYED